MQSIIRVKKEYREVQKEKGAGISAVLVLGDYAHWEATIDGPQGSIYEKGKFQIDITIPNNYPFVPPKMRFKTKVWHPNVSSQTGAICLDILKTEWSPALTLRTALLSLQALLSTPNADDPQDAQVAAQYKKDRKAFNQTAAYWVSIYAQPQKNDSESIKIKKLVAMGFDEKSSKAALEKCKWDETAAIMSLVT